MTQRMKYKVVQKEAYSINAGELKRILADIDNDTIICFNKVHHKGDKDIFGNTIIKGYIKQKYKIGNSQEVAKIILTPYPTTIEDFEELNANGDDDDTDSE